MSAQRDTAGAAGAKIVASVFDSFHIAIITGLVRLLGHTELNLEIKMQKLLLSKGVGAHYGPFV
jgi:hypothetical protein